MRAYFESCLLLGKLLRGARYSTTRVAATGSTVEVRKRREAYAPVLVALGEPVAWALDAGVIVLPQHSWEQRERLLYERLYGQSIHVERHGTLVLPHLAGQTLAAWLEDESLDSAARIHAIQLAATALAQFHAKGFTHADAMAENVMVDLDAGVARWFDFETEHEPGRNEAWRRGDDIRALIATCVLRSQRSDFASTIDCILRSYANNSVLPHVAASFSQTTQRALAFHLGQAPVSYDTFQEVGRLLHQRLGNGAFTV